MATAYTNLKINLASERFIFQARGNAPDGMDLEVVGAGNSDLGTSSNRLEGAQFNTQLALCDAAVTAGLMAMTGRNVGEGMEP